MCLAIPMKIIERNGNSGIVENNGIKKNISLSLVDANIGEYVLVHAGIAIAKIEERIADETISMLKELIRSCD